MRPLAQEAGLPVSSIYHHFGSLNHLYVAAQNAARASAEHWCSIRLDEIGGADSLPNQALPALLATLIDEWSQNHRREALAWRECYLLAARDGSYRPVLESWQRIWVEFCQEIASRCGLSEFGEATSLFFDGESLLHLMQWRRSVDRAALEESCRGWLSWITGSLTDEGPWRRFARLEASRAMPAVPAFSEVAEAIARAAADIIERNGVAGLTHRAVAAEAGLTLGVVSHNFRTSAELARAAFETIYRRILATAYQDQSTAVDMPGQAIDQLTAYRFSPTQQLAIDELMLATVRQPEFQPFAPQLRYLRGRSSGLILQSLLGGSAPSPLDAALFSSFLSGLKRATTSMEVGSAQAYARKVVEPLLCSLKGLAT